MKKLLYALLILLSLSCSKKDDLPNEPDKVVQPKDTIQLNEVYSIFAASDSSFLIAGESDSKFTLLKTDHDLNIIWKRTDFEWGNIEYGCGYSSCNYPNYVGIFQNADGNYTCLSSMRFGGDVVLFYAELIQLNPDGEILLEKRISKSPYHDVIRTNDGGFIGLNRWDGLKKYDKNFALCWNKEFNVQHDFPRYDLSSIFQTIDEGYILTSVKKSSPYTNVKNSSMLLKKLDNSGEDVWEKTVNCPIHHCVGWDVVQLDDSGLLVAGSLKSYSDDAEGFVVRTDESGDSLWTKKVGRENADWLQNIIRVADGSAIIVGVEREGEIYHKSSILVKINLYSGEIEKLEYKEKIECITDSHAGYFIVAQKNEDGGLIQFSRLSYDFITLDKFSPNLYLN